MTRFEETLHRDLTVIADRATPSPDAWAQIQSRIDAEEPIQETEIIMLTENTSTPRRWPLVAAAAAVVAIAVGAIALVNRGDDTELPADTPDTVPVVNPDTVTPDAVEPDDAEPAEEEAEPASLLRGELPGIDEPVAAGTYSTDELGVPLTFDVTEGLGDQFTRVTSRTGAIQLAVRGTAVETIAIGRVGSFYGSAAASDGTTQGLGSIPADDIDGWIAANDINVDERSEVTIGDRPAELRRVRFDNKHPNGFWAFSGSADVDPVKPEGFFGDSDDAHLFWVVDMNEFEPIIIWATSNTPDQQQWIDDVVMPLVTSIEFGDPAPAVEGGTARVPLREQFFATAITPRGEGTVLEDGTIERTGVSTLTGDLTGEMVGTGIEVTPANGYDDIVFTGTIDGIGEGTLTMYQEWTASQNGDIAFTTTITDASGDFTGITGRVITALDQPDESGPVPIFESRLTFLLTIPVSG